MRTACQTTCRKVQGRAGIPLWVLSRQYVSGHARMWQYAGRTVGLPIWMMPTRPCRLPLSHMRRMPMETGIFTTWEQSARRMRLGSHLQAGYMPSSFAVGKMSVRRSLQVRPPTGTPPSSLAPGRQDGGHQGTPCGSWTVFLLHVHLVVNGSPSVPFLHGMCPLSGPHPPCLSPSHSRCGGSRSLWRLCVSLSLARVNLFSCLPITLLELSARSV